VRVCLQAPHRAYCSGVAAGRSGGSVDELTDGTVGSIDVAMAAGVGSIEIPAETFYERGAHHASPHDIVLHLGR